jgi:hypothetical protein
MAENTWSNWKRFWVGGGPKVQITPAAIIPLGGGATKQFSLDQPGEVVTFGKGKMKRFDSAKPIASPVAHGPMQTRQGQLPPGTGPQNASGPMAGALAKPAVVRPSAALSIGTIAVAPVGPDGFIAQGAAVMLSVEVKNAGPADAPATSTVKLECIVKSGGACPVASHTQPVGKSIPAGSSRSFTLVSASPSQPGTYQVRITPVNGRRGSGGQVDLKVKGMQISPAAAGKINRNLGAQPQGAGQIQRVPAATPPAMQPADKNENGASHNEMLRVPAAKPVEPTR